MRQGPRPIPRLEIQRRVNERIRLAALRVLVRDVDEEETNSETASGSVSEIGSENGNDVGEEGSDVEMCDVESDSDSSVGGAQIMHVEDDNVSLVCGDGSDYAASQEGEDSGSDADRYEDVQQEEVNFDNDEERGDYVLRELRKWALRGVSCTKIDALLAILRPLFPVLPKSYKTLLQTPRSVTTIPVGIGQLWYKGIAVSIQQRISQAPEYLEEREEIVMDVNMDGLPPFRSTYHDCWPTLGCLEGEDEPFIIAAWIGVGKMEPDDVDSYLEQYVNEVRNLLQNGIQLNGTQYPFRVRDYILDAPARAFVKRIKGHTGTYACESCEVRGVKIRRVQTFLDLDAIRRTDESFANRRNPQHHKGLSPLEALGTRMVSQFRKDGLHLLHLGVFGRWCDFVFGNKKKKKRGIVTRVVKQAVSDTIEGLVPHMPREINRIPRPLKYRPKYRASEYRRLFLYDGLLAFKNLQNLTPNVYQNYLILHAACYILSSPELYLTMNDAADMLLRDFIDHSRRLFGDHFVAYYIHNLVHFAEECRLHGTVDSFSCYKYESFLAVIKELLRSTYLPLQQIAYRDSERQGKLCNPKKHAAGDVRLFLRHPPQDENIEGEQYFGVEFGKKTLAVNEKDSGFKTHNGEIAILTNIVYTPAHEVILVGHIFQSHRDFYEDPLPSSRLGIVTVSNLSERKMHWNLRDVQKKCMILPIENQVDEYLCIPMLHSGAQ